MHKTELIWIIGILFLCAPLTNSFGLDIGVRGNSNYIGGLKLLYPTTDDIDLSGKDFLEFRWERRNIIQTDHLELRLYKGYQTIESTLILKQNFPSNVYPITLSASLFEESQVYTWSLRQVLLGGRKSDDSFSSFKIIKR